MLRLTQFVNLGLLLSKKIAILSTLYLAFTTLTITASSVLMLRNRKFRESVSEVLVDALGVP